MNEIKYDARASLIDKLLLLDEGGPIGLTPEEAAIYGVDDIDFLEEERDDE